MEYIESKKDKIKDLKNSMKENLLIAAHHYQNIDIVNLADLVGDSYILAKKTSENPKENIILCGVRFMAQTVKMLAKDNQRVYIPGVDAQCPLAEMVKLDELKFVYDFLKNIKKLDIVLITYVNSYVDIKAFTGKTGGSCCTSSNAEKIIKYYLNDKKKIIFLPDFYLGINTANKIKGLKVKRIFERNEFILKEEEDYNEVDIFLWKGFCPVHQVYSVNDIDIFKEKYPNAKVIVHPESKEEVVDKADFAGSTEYIYNLVKNSKPGSIWVVGTESTFVNRLQKENPDKMIFSLKESYCKNMQKNNLENLCNLIYAIKENRATDYEIKIDGEDKFYGKISLDNMINIVEGKI